MADPRYGEKPRSIRIDDELWAASVEATARRGETVSEVVRRALRSYVRRHSAK